MWGKNVRGIILLKEFALKLVLLGSNLTNNDIFYGD